MLHVNSHSEIHIIGFEENSISKLAISITNTLNNMEKEVKYAQRITIVDTKYSHSKYSHTALVFYTKA